MKSFFRLCNSILILSISTLLCACSPDKKLTLLDHLPQNTQQVLFVTSTSWSTPKGTLQRFEKSQGQWKKVGTTIPVMLGRNGAAWGRGLHSNDELTLFKQEGDGKAPAGVFKLGSSFGYANTALKNQSYPYKQASERDYYIDDVESADYNQWVKIPIEQANTPKSHWNSYEKMHRDDGLYEWGIEVEHNKNPVKPRSGSAIFMHIWKSSETSTAGCTAMPKADLITLLEWLDRSKNPLLIQAPEAEIKNIHF